MAMRFILSISSLFIFSFLSYGQAGDHKIILSDSNNSIEFTPYNIQEDGAVIEPVNNVDDKGVNTIFYLRDTSYWSFYTNALNRLSIKGNGSILASGPLLINNAIDDGKSSLRVNGRARFDSAVFIQASSSADSNSFISFERNIKGRLEAADGISPYATTPTLWADGINLPVFRIRHPNNVSNKQNINTSAQRDFKIYPYQYGMTLDYNGVVECWVGEWSIHRGLNYLDLEGNGNGWGGVLWVGDDHDQGGVRATARNNGFAGGNIMYGELSVEKFAGASNGDFRFRLPENQNQFQFVYGPRGSTNIIAKISNEGLIIPGVSSTGVLQTPQKAQMLFDSSANQFKGFDGSEWVSLQENIKTGVAESSADGNSRIYSIPHSLQVTPAYFNVLATSEDAGDIKYATANATHILIHYSVAPPAGTNNLSWNWQVKK